MNSLSWSLYLADVVENLRGLVDVIPPFGLIGYAVGTLVYAAKIDSDNAEEIEKRPYFHGKWWPLWILLGVSVFATIIPKKSTIMMIAASQAGQYALENPKVQETSDKLLGAVNSYLDGLQKKPEEEKK